MRQLVFIHGREQEKLDPVVLKSQWLAALREGLAKSQLRLPIAEQDVRFPYYGDTLFDLVGGKSAEAAAEIIVRGTNADTEEQRFMRAILDEARRQAGITDDQLAAIASQEVLERGPLNWGWVQVILQGIDRYVPGASSTTLALFTYDVSQYLNNSAIREIIDEGVSTAFHPNVETVVVGHSLGSVVAYNLLRQQGHLRGWQVPLLVTVGSPLAVGEIRRSLRSFAPTRCPACVSRWFNALDERDVVALYPLDTTHFPLNPATPAIENKSEVRNKTSNHHGIGGYLDDQKVARRIYDALVA